MQLVALHSDSFSLTAQVHSDILVARLNGRLVGATDEGNPVDLVGTLLWLCPKGAYSHLRLDLAGLTELDWHGELALEDLLSRVADSSVQFPWGKCVGAANFIKRHQQDSVTQAARVDLGSSRANASRQIPKEKPVADSPWTKDARRWQHLLAEAGFWEMVVIKAFILFSLVVFCAKLVAGH